MDLIEYQNILKRLTSSKAEERILAAENIRDIYEDEYRYQNPAIELTSLFVDRLISAILVELNEEVQYILLDALYAWSWFPSDSSYLDDILKNQDKFLTTQARVLSIEVLIASGEIRFKSFYESLLEETAPICLVAKKGLESFE